MCCKTINYDFLFYYIIYIYILFHKLAFAGEITSQKWRHSELKVCAKSKEKYEKKCFALLYDLIQVYYKLYNDVLVNQ